MRVAIGKFAQSGIETRLGADVAAVVGDGLAHYTRRLTSGEPPLEVPRFCADHFQGDAEEQVEVPLDPEVEEALKREARRQQVPLTRILSHAVLVYLARLDASSIPEPDLLH